MNKITACIITFCLSAIGTLMFQIRNDIHAIRETLEPKAITFGVEPPPFRARFDFRETSHQEPEVTLL